MSPLSIRSAGERYRSSCSTRACCRSVFFFSSLLLSPRRPSSTSSVPYPPSPAASATSRSQGIARHARVRAWACDQRDRGTGTNATIDSPPERSAIARRNQSARSSSPPYMPRSLKTSTGTPLRALSFIRSANSPVCSLGPLASILSLTRWRPSTWISSPMTMRWSCQKGASR